MKKKMVIMLVGTMLIATLLTGCGGYRTTGVGADCWQH